MRPSSRQLLEGIRWSFDTYILPDVESRLGLSAARSIDVLLGHLLERVESEGELLSEDNEEMRALFADLAECLEPAGAEGSPLQEALSELGETSERVFRATGAYPGIESLLLENEDLKRALVRMIRALQGSRDQLPQEQYDRADALIRAQLRSQLDREHRWIAPLIGRRPY